MGIKDNNIQDKRRLMNKNFKLINADTDSITVCKADMSPISEEEQESLLNELNSLFPETIKFEDDGYFDSFVVLKAKNYIMRDAKGKIKIKGSSMKSLKTEKIMKDMIQEIVQALVEHRLDDTVAIYNKYIVMSQNVTDITQWSKKQTITKPILNCKGWTEEDIENKLIRRNEIEVWEAVKNTHIQEGDRVQLYPAVISHEVVLEPIIRKNRKTGEMEHKGFKEVENIKYGLKRIEDYNNDEDKEHLLKRVYDTLSIFKTILDMDKYVKYHNKTNFSKLHDLLKK